jgi:protein-S-isoprenylcysteine O-methyltransferase Ste14
MAVTNKQGGARVRFPPPLVFLTTLVVAVLVDRFVLPLAIPLALVPRLAIGAVLVGAGAAFGIPAQRWFRRTGQNPVPWTPSTQLLVNGIYARTRNPMYVGMAFMELGLGVAYGTAWVILATPIALAINHVIAVRPEEAYLAHKFGDDYARYKDRVRRYL